MFIYGVQAERLQVHYLNGFRYQVRKERAASKWNNIRLSQKGESFIQSLGSVIICDHRVSVNEVIIQLKSNAEIAALFDCFVFIM